MTGSVYTNLTLTPLLAETPLSPGCTLMSPQVGTQLTPQWTQWSPGWTPLSPPCTQHKEQIINLTNLEMEYLKNSFEFFLALQ